MMQHSRRPSFLATLGVALVTGAVPIGAQQVRVVTPRTARAESSLERQLRALERRADSLAHLYSDADELSVAERRRIGEMLDRTVEQFETLSARLADMSGDDAVMRVRVAPMASSQAQTYMRQALTEARQVVPRGWLGIVVNGAAREPRVENGELIVRYLTHPVIVSVDPSSPAERAGLIPSDTLVAYDGKDVCDTDIAITRLLQPNKRVKVRIRRDGRTFDVPVTIADAPSRISIRREMSLDVAPRSTPLPSVAFPREAPVARAAGGAAWARAPEPAMPATPSASTPMPAIVPMPPVAYGFGFGGASAVAGAQFVPITAGLGRSFGVRNGVLVTNAPVGSPAYESGLRDGDVIVRAAGQTLRTVADLRERVAAAANDGEHSLALELVRSKRTRKGTLRW